MTGKGEGEEGRGGDVRESKRIERRKCEGRVRGLRAEEGEEV